MIGLKFVEFSLLVSDPQPMHGYPPAQSRAFLLVRIPAFMCVLMGLSRSDRGSSNGCRGRHKYRNIGNAVGGRIYIRRHVDCTWRIETENGVNILKRGGRIERKEMNGRFGSGRFGCGRWELEWNESMTIRRTGIPVFLHWGHGGQWLGSAHDREGSNCGRGFGAAGLAAAVLVLASCWLRCNRGSLRRC